MKNKMVKRIASLILAVSMLCSMAPAAFAVDNMGDTGNISVSDTGNTTGGSQTDGSGTADDGSGGEDPGDSDPSDPESAPDEQNPGASDTSDENVSGTEDENTNESTDSVDGTDNTSDIVNDDEINNAGEQDSDDMSETPNAPQQPIEGNDEVDHVQDGEEVKEPQNTPENLLPTPAPMNAEDATYYVANSSNGGSDTKGTGESDSPFLTIQKAIETAEGADAQTLEIILLSDVPLSQEVVIDNADMPITFTSDGNYRIYFSGTTPIGSSSGFIRVVNGAEATFEGVTLAGSTGTYDGRVIYVAENGTVNLSDTTVTDGIVNNVMNNEGGAGAMVADLGTLNVGSGVVFEGNTTVAGGGAIFVANGGTANISGDAEISDNNARLGGGIYADTQTNDYGGLSISDNVTITGNTATDGAKGGSGMYVMPDAAASVEGDVTINGNRQNGQEYNVYLADKATLDISGATTGANIGISADPEYAYRLVSLPDGYDIQPTKDGDEKGWHDDCGAWDIRHMTYQGVEGLYLYYKTLDMTFEDINTLATISGPDINGETVDYLNDNLPSCTKDDSVLTVADTVSKDPDKDDDLTITFTVDKDEYRIPTEDVIDVTSGGSDVEFTYVPDFENGTATITIADAVVDALTDTLKFEISAEKYYTLTLRMEGPLYSMDSSITGLTENVLTLAGKSFTGTTGWYKITSGGNPVEGVQISLYKEADVSGQPVATATTGADGVANFTGLEMGTAYYPALLYERSYRVITRDVVDLDLSTLEGQTLAANCVCDAGADGHVTYDASQKDAKITGITSDAKVTFSVTQIEDTIYFHGNEGEATTAPASLSMDSKKMTESLETYGTLATATLVGYDFVGWFDAPEGGNQITSDTPYQTGVSPRNLYAHWTARTDTQYNINHWVELVEAGVNVGYEAGTTQTKTDNGITYYLYETTPYTNGTSDQVIDITSLDLKSMSDEEITWWTREGFTARFQSDCKVLANGTSEFSVYYDRNTYNIFFDPSGEGSVTSDDEFDPKSVKFGDQIGELPLPTLPGYAFGGWYYIDQLVTATDMYDKTEDITVEAHWTARDDTNWAIKVAVQDLVQDPETGEYSAGDTYTEYKTVYKGNDGELLSFKLQGTTDTQHEFAISSIDELTIYGFNYVGYADEYNQTGRNMVKDTENAICNIKPTDMSTELNGEYNEAFDGGIVWLYYDRKTAHVDPDPSQPGGDGDGGDIIYGGDFTGQLPPDPGKDGYDFDGWTDEDGNPIDENTPADEYVEEDGTVVVYPTWEARDYRLTYVPGDGASFRASDGSAGTVNPSVPGGYTDSHDVTYDEPMGLMPQAFKPGYDFVGWFLEDGTEVTSEAIVSVDNVVIHRDDFAYEDTRPLYAKYEPHKYTLVLMPGNSPLTGEAGTVEPKTVEVTFDQIIEGLPIPELRGYTFVSWVIREGENSTIIENGDIWTKVYQNGARIPVYANYTPNTYRYTFDLNDDEGSTKATLFDTTIDYAEETFDSVYEGVFKVEAIRPGYTFMGWSLTEDGDPLTTDQIVAIAEDSTVYAIWQPKQFEIKFVMKGSTMPPEFNERFPDAVYNTEADTWTIKIDFDSTYGLLPPPTKEDATYQGWLVDAPNWPEIHNEIIKELPQYTDYSDIPGITLTAVMEVWITFDPDGNPFVDDGSTDPRKELQSEIDVLPEVTKPDYTFDGWVTEDDPDKILTVDDIKDFDVPTTVKPHFSANITFDANGGKINGQDTQVIALSKLTTLPSASYSGYTLNGWYTAAEGGTEVTLQQLIDAGVPATVYAHWTRNSPGGGGSSGGGGGGGGTPSYTITVEEDEGADVTPDGTVKVPSGGDKEFIIDAEDGYIVVDVIVDGESIGVVDKYEFENVKENHTLEVKVEKMLTGDHIAYINGYPDKGVHPQANITRAEVAAIFYRLLTDEARDRYEASTSRFADANSNWAAKEIATLTSAGIIEGYEDGTFRPDASITRAEYAAIASRFDKLESGTMRFSDVPSTHWAYSAIASAAEKGWINGYSDGTFRPDNNITRAEAVTLTNAVLNRICDEEFVAEHIDEVLTFNDLPSTHWAYGAIMEAANAHDYEGADGIEHWTALK